MQFVTTSKFLSQHFYKKAVSCISFSTGQLVMVCMIPSLIYPEKFWHTHSNGLTVTNTTKVISNQQKNVRRK